jgi:hypothetical protein
MCHIQSKFQTEQIMAIVTYVHSTMNFLHNSCLRLQACFPEKCWICCTTCDCALCQAILSYDRQSCHTCDDCLRHLNLSRAYVQHTKRCSMMGINTYVCRYVHTTYIKTFLPLNVKELFAWCMLPRKMHILIKNEGPAIKNVLLV